MIVYRTENKINGKFYYGVTNGNNPSYIGSGKNITRAINKYGKENFVRRTIMEFETEDEAYAFEALIVDELLLSNPDCYNITLGGGNPPMLKSHSEETCLLYTSPSPRDS